MMKTRLLNCLRPFFWLSLPLGLVSQGAKAQQTIYPCGTVQMMQELEKTHPGIMQAEEETQKLLQQMEQDAAVQRMQGVKKIIPVVVHIIHEGGSENITTAQVEDAIRILNRDFAGLNPDTVDVIPAFRNRIGRAEIEFRLARLDPQGNCTDGITRTYSSLTNTAGENVKSLIKWDNTRYLNVWVVKVIASGAGGYAFIPCNNPIGDGIVIRHTQFGGIGTSGGNFSARSFTHEVGHYFGLRHTWGPTNDPGVASNCSVDDGVTDTPNCAGVANQNCPTTLNSCGAGTPGDEIDNVQNYMDYANCAKMFTTGQAQRMETSAMLGCRTSLWAQSNLVATGTNDGFTAGPCAPIADFLASTNRICQGSVVSFQDKSYNAVVDNTWTWNWSFPGGTPTTAATQNPVVTYNTPGVYNVTLTVANASGNGTVTKQQIIQVVTTTGGETAPVAESFENPTFPTHPTDALKNWEVDNSTTVTWERTTAAALDGTASMRIRNGFIPDQRVNSLITPNVIVVPQSSLKLAYAFAYSKGGTNAAENLKIYLSTDCGKSWQLRKAYSGASTGPNSLVTSTDPAVPFVPAGAADWRQDSITVNIGSTDHVLFKFEATSDNGNTIYLDKVRIGGNMVGMEELSQNVSFTIFPNPSSGDATLRFGLSQPEKVTVTLTNLLGQELAARTAAMNAGQHDLALRQLHSSLSAGVYLVQVRTAGRTMIQKLVIE